VVDEPRRLSAKRAENLLRDLADEPFVALVMPPGTGDIKVYVKGVSPDKMMKIRKVVEAILNEDSRILGYANTDACEGEMVEVTLA
jgi:hypothetical protein